MRRIIKYTLFTIGWVILWPLSMKCAQVALQMANIDQDLYMIGMFYVAIAYHFYRIFWPKNQIIDIEFEEKEVNYEGEEIKM